MMAGMRAARYRRTQRRARRGWQRLRGGRAGARRTSVRGRRAAAGSGVTARLRHGHTSRTRMRSGGDRGRAHGGFPVAGWGFPGGCDVEWVTRKAFLLALSSRFTQFQLGCGHKPGAARKTTPRAAPWERVAWAPPGGSTRLLVPDAAAARVPDRSGARCAFNRAPAYLGDGACSTLHPAQAHTGGTLAAATDRLRSRCQRPGCWVCYGGLALRWRCCIAPAAKWSAGAPF